MKTKVVKHMKFTINGKRLKEMINLCLLKGKYNQGLTNSKGQMGNCVKITTKQDTVWVENADASTYIRVNNRASNMEGQETRIYVNAEMLTKYLTDNESTILVKDSNLVINNNDSVAEIPALESHEYAHVIVRFSDNMQTDYENSESYAVTEKLVLNTRVELTKSDFINAVSMAERVGSCIYTFVANKNSTKFSITSDNLRESITTNISSSETITKDAIGSYSLPISNALKLSRDDELVIFYDDEKPIIFCTNDMVIMRAPRMEA